jgi:hypothetical protein
VPGLKSSSGRAVVSDRTVDVPVGRAASDVDGQGCSSLAGAPGREPEPAGGGGPTITAMSSGSLLGKKLTGRSANYQWCPVMTRREEA